MLKSATLGIWLHIVLMCHKIRDFFICKVYLKVHPLGYDFILHWCVIRFEISSCAKYAQKWNPGICILLFDSWSLNSMCRACRRHVRENKRVHKSVASGYSASTTLHNFMSWRCFRDLPLEFSLVVCFSTRLLTLVFRTQWWVVRRQF